MSLSDNLPQQNQTPQQDSNSIADSLRRIVLEENDGDDSVFGTSNDDSQPAQEPTADDGGQTQDDGQQEGEPGEGESQPAEQSEAWAMVAMDDGTQVAVPAPLKDSFLRHADYSRKTAELANERRAVEQLRSANEAIYSVATQFAPLLAEVHTAQQRQEQFDKVDWEALYEQDPVLHNKLRMDARDNLDRLQNLGRTLQAAPAMMEQMQAQALAAEVARNYPLAKQLVPDFESRRDELAAVGRHYGFSEQELRTTPDARAVKVLADLADYHRLLAGQQQTRQKIAAVPPVVRPGAKSAPNADKNINDTRKALRNDSSSDAFVRAMRAQRKRG